MVTSHFSVEGGPLHMQGPEGGRGHSDHHGPYADVGEEFVGAFDERMLRSGEGATGPPTGVKQVILDVNLQKRRKMEERGK